MSKKVIDLPDIGTVVLHKRKKSRSIRLTITHDGEVRVTMPSWAPYRLGQEFAKTKSSWIAERKQPKIDISNGSTIGKSHTLFIRFAPTESPRTKITSTIIQITLPDSWNSYDPIAQLYISKACHRALKLQATQLLPERVARLAQQHGYTFNDIKIKKLKSRWGSCTEKQHLVFNYYLLQLPWDFIDYVILHELAHTKIMSHSKEFWDEVTSKLPNVNYYKKTIKHFKPTLLPAKSSAIKPTLVHDNQ